MFYNRKKIGEGINYVQFHVDFISPVCLSVGLFVCLFVCLSPALQFQPFLHICVFMKCDFLIPLISIPFNKRAFCAA